MTVEEGARTLALTRAAQELELRRDEFQLAVQMGLIRTVPAGAWGGGGAPPGGGGPPRGGGGPPPPRGGGGGGGGPPRGLLAAHDLGGCLAD
ncbi:DUF6397 family protein, partial [Streptomyces sp. NPDC015346]|uniref:DUF6397 family protein n=1 Tax=Streptomyces sp. NPDC015346 TaxID=3364954 RepID=UPI00370294CF